MIFTLQWIVCGATIEIFQALDAVGVIILILNPAFQLGRVKGNGYFFLAKSYAL